jgi:hypothetical protein
LPLSEPAPPAVLTLARLAAARQPQDQVVVAFARAHGTARRTVL